LRGVPLTKVKAVKKYHDLLSQHFFFCQINLDNLFGSDNICFEFLAISIVIQFQIINSFYFPFQRTLLSLL